MINTAQFVIRVLCRPLLFFLARLEVVGRDNAEKTSKPLLVISNHKSYYDPLVIAAALPVFSKVYPLRFIGKDQLFRNFISRWFFGWLGVFPAFYGQGLDRSLQIPTQILKNRGVVVFFPEGKCVREEGLGPPKPGAATLALRVPEGQILPIAIQGSYRIGRPVFNRPKVRISIGQPFDLKERADLSGTDFSVEEVSELFIREIGALFDKPDSTQAV